MTMRDGCDTFSCFFQEKNDNLLINLHGTQGSVLGSLLFSLYAFGWSNLEQNKFTLVTSSAHNKVVVLNF